ncbi:MAG: endonuclease III [Euryarchaeota archaeon]|nr:endonuclease III [Euryarchaeota archaeon]
MEEKVKEIISLLEREYPNPRTALKYSTPFELLVATILSAQSTDVQVNRITRTLFRKYQGPEDFARVSQEELEQDIRSSGFFRQKARNIRAASRMILEEFAGEVPRSMAELTRLPGVARKTANIVLSNAFGIHEGIAVDTHVKRLSMRLGLSDKNDPNRIEQDLMAVVPREYWRDFSHLLILHGRSVCRARRPRHEECVLYHLCPSREG